jgi:hypothetical protein
MTQNKIVTTGTMAGRASYPPGASFPPQAHNGTGAICDHVYCFMWVHVTEGKVTGGRGGGCRTLLHKENTGRSDSTLFQTETFLVHYTGMQLPFCTGRLNHSEELLA